jgi:ankyrin repeat protein
MDPDLASKLLAAARAGDAAQVRALVPCAGNPEEDGLLDAPGGTTPLMAAAAGHEAVVEVLLECGADAAKRDARGRRAAAHARAGGRPCLAKRLDTVVEKDQTIR